MTTTHTRQRKIKIIIQSWKTTFLQTRSLPSTLKSWIDEESPLYSEKLNHFLFQTGELIHCQLSRTMTSGHNRSMELRLQRKHLLIHFDSNVDHEIYLNETKRKEEANFLTNKSKKEKHWKNEKKKREIINMKTKSSSNGSFLDPVHRFSKIKFSQRQILIFKKRTFIIIIFVFYFDVYWHDWKLKKTQKWKRHSSYIEISSSNFQIGNRLFCNSNFPTIFDSFSAKIYLKDKREKKMKEMKNMKK